MRDPNYGEQQGQERSSQQQGNKGSRQEMNQGDSSRERSHNPIGVAERLGTGRRGPS